MKKTLPKISLFVIFFFCLNQSLHLQPEKIKTPSEILIALEKLNVLGSVLYIAAHPDDENTSLMAYLSKGKKFRTGYLSLTRGDGGQNLIGSEKGVEIGILRTQELLQARKFDNGEQYFTRAIDFGFSKSSDETFRIWNKEEVLKDIVWVIRNFQPDVIITRFPLNGDGGHGHHIASALLAEEAFNAAADPKIFPEQLKYVQPWQTKRIFWNSWRPENTKGLLTVDVGEYNPLLAESYTETGAKSRTMHKSQGFGSTGSRGSRFEYFQLIDGDSAKEQLLDSINTTWNRVENGGTIGKYIEDITKNFNPSSPSSSIPSLILLYNELSKPPNNYWVDIKKKELLDIIKSCAGLWMEAIAEDYSAVSGDEISLKTTIVNRSGIKFKINKIEFPTLNSDSLLSNELNNNQPMTIESKIKISASYKISQPYWLEEKSSKGLFKVSDRNMVGLAENSPSVPVKIILECDGQRLEYTIPLLFRWNDRVDGELYRPFEIRPPTIVNIAEKVAVFPDDKPKEIQLRIKSNTSNVDGFIHFEKTDGWEISPAQIPFQLKNKYDEKLISITVTPPKNQGEVDLKILLNIKGKDYDKSLVEISYPHIVPQVYFPESDLKLVKLNIEKISGKIGYILGSGDDIPGCLSNMGYDVTLISDEMLEGNHLSQYDAIITGVRAYNTRERLKYAQPKLLEYVKNGGTLIVQYNVAFGLQTLDIGPYPFRISQDRITDEDAKINFVEPGNQLLNFPNKISKIDFEGWVQERGLYFADQWDSKYKTVFSGNDNGDKDLSGGMLFTKYGKGVFIYSGYSWFRQLPAGVPGAYRIFINMISAGKYGG
jgi:LmbE family N-acetylglucosaminyl deacetylase